MSISIPLDFRMFESVSLMMERVFSPRKSILTNPTSSITVPSYCVITLSSLVSLSTAVLSGTRLIRSSAPIMSPQACTPVWRTVPSSISAYFRVLESIGFDESRDSRSSSTYLKQLLKFTLMSFPFSSLGNLPGTSLVSRSASERGSFWTRATSLMADFVPMVP